MTPAKAAQAISDSVAENPAPKPNGPTDSPTPLARWYDGLKTRLSRAISQARSFFLSATHDEALRQGWQGSQMRDAGLSGPAVKQAALDRVQERLQPQMAALADLMDDEGISGSQELRERLRANEQTSSPPSAPTEQKPPSEASQEPEDDDHEDQGPRLG